MSSDGESSAEGGRVERAVRVTAGLISLGYSLWLIWYLVPEHSRRLMLMRLSQGIQRRAESMAFRSGRLAMREEARSGVPNYLIPYRFSLLAQWAHGVYEKLRYTA